MTEPQTETLEDGTTRVRLATPVHAHGEEVTELVLRPPSVRDLKSLDRAQGDVSRAIVLIAQLAQVPPSTIEGMTDLRDFSALSEAASSFLEASGLSVGSEG